MPEQNKPFVVTDRRKFTMDGELRPDADPSPEREERAATPAEPVAPAAAPPQATATSSSDATAQPEMPPPPTAEENDQARRAYEMTADRLRTALRPAHP